MSPITSTAVNVSPDRPCFEDEIWVMLDPFLFPPKAFKKAFQEIDAIMEKTSLSEGRVLDLACGPGRHSIPLAKRGWRVTGVDRSPFLLNKAREYADCERLDIEFIQEDMRYFSRPNSYDLVLSLYSSFGFFDDPADNIKVLENAYASLKKGGTLFLDLPGREVLARNFKSTVRRRVKGLGQVTEYRTVSTGWKRLGLAWRFYTDGQLRNYSFRLWLYSAEDMRKMLEQAGFSNIGIYGDFEMNAYDHRAKQLIVSAVK